MRKVLINQMEKIGEFAKKVAVESQNTSSYFLYYEPKSPKGIKEGLRNSINMEDVEQEKVNIR